MVYGDATSVITRLLEEHTMYNLLVEIGEDNNNSSYLLLRSLYSALEPECKVNIVGAKSSIRLGEQRGGYNKIIIEIQTEYISTLRALINSYLRLIDAAYKSINATKE